MLLRECRAQALGRRKHLLYVYGGRGRLQKRSEIERYYSARNKPTPSGGETSTSSAILCGFHELQVPTG